MMDSHRLFVEESVPAAKKLTLDSVHSSMNTFMYEPQRIVGKHEEASRNGAAESLLVRGQIRLRLLHTIAGCGIA
jgi:hypothetical protein